MADQVDPYELATECAEEASNVLVALTKLAKASATELPSRWIWEIRNSKEDNLSQMDESVDQRPQPSEERRSHTTTMASTSIQTRKLVDFSKALVKAGN